MPISISLTDSALILQILGVVFGLFVIWYEARKDGFDDHRIFDIAFSSSIIGYVVYYGLGFLRNWLSIYYLNNILLKLLTVPAILLLCFCFMLAMVLIGLRKSRWSLYRILDIYSLGWAGFLLFISMSTFSLKTILLGAFLLLVPRYRSRRFVSGLSFSAFCFMLALFSIYSWEDLSRFTLSLILVIIGMLNLVFFSRKFMLKNILPSNLIAQIRNKLLAKKKNLDLQQDLLEKEDPYKREGRDIESSEALEEAVFEDARKVDIERTKERIEDASEDVEGALKSIEAGTYGICSVCGKPIDKARLEVYPEADKCIECAEDEA